MLALLAVLLLAAPGAFAAQERMPPDGFGADGCDWNSGACDWNNLVEDPDGPGTDWEPADDNRTDHSGHFTFGTPTQPLTAGAGLQEFRASVRKNATCGSGTPTAQIELWESGSSVRAGSAVAVTAANSCTQGTDCQVISFTWNATEISNAADVEVTVFGFQSGGGGPVRCAVDLGAVEWNAEVSAAGPTLPTLSTPTAASIDTGSATLGATITSDGGETTSAYGTVWDTTPTPTANALAAGASASAPPDFPFSHGRTISQTPGTRIFYAGYATNSAGTGYSSDGSFFLEPNQATGVSFSNVTDTGMRVSWTLPGTGAGDGTIVVMKQGSAVSGTAADGTLYTASSSFGSGSDLGGGSFVVFQGSGTQVDVTNLSASTTYFVELYTYAGTTEPLVNYQQTSPVTGSQPTNAAGAVPVLSTPTATTIDTGNATLGATIDDDNGDGVTVYGTVWDTTPSPSANAASAGTNPGSIPPALPFSHGRAISQTPGTRIYYRGYATNGAGTGYSTGGSFYLEPNQATGVSFSNVTSSGMRVSWTLPGTGAGDGTIVVMKQGSTVSGTAADGTLYTASSSFASGSDLGGGSFVVFQGSGTQVDVTNLSASTTYFVELYTYAGTTEPLVNYQQTSPVTDSQATNAAGTLPELSTPTVSSIGATTATLGATITNDNGDAVTDYGTVWDTTPSPTANAVSAGTNPGTIPPAFPFSHGRTGLPQASLIYYAGYATNSAGTGYSPDGSFYTDPQSQASLVRFRGGGLETELTFDWSAGSGEGAIVLMRLGTAVDADPVDGVEYLDGGNVFAAGSEIGTGNYVVYVGAALGVTVTGLASDLTYHVAVYEYAGSGSLINYLQASPPRGSSGHNAAHGVECSGCHFLTGDLHGKFGVPRDAEQENTCKSCHNDTGDASGKIDIAIHIGTNYNVSVDCGSCHELHNNFDFTTTDAHSGGVTAANVEWIRPDTTKYVSGALEPALFQANTGFFAWDDANEPWNGLCQNCHTGTDRHTNDNTTAHSHEVTNDCTGCHGHLDGFRGTGGDCTDCHSQVKGSRRRIVDSGPGAGDGEFGSGFTSHHVNDGSTNEIVTKWDCVVCHAEGDALTGSTDGTYHQKDGVQLKDVDTGTVYSDWSGLTPLQRSDFCLSCHDTDGATIITGRTDPDPDATTSALNPFNDGLTNAHELDGFDGTPAPHSRGAVVDVAAQFDTLNASHHAVLGPAYGSAAPFGSPIDNAIQGVRTDLAWNSTLDCEDCHYGTGTTMLSAHGTANARYMLRDKDGNDTLASGANVNCYRCHDPADARSTFSDHDRGAHIDDSLNLYDISCLNCHGGGEWGGIHGVDDPVTDDDGGGTYNPNVFTYGAGLDLISSWSQWSNLSCSTPSQVSRINACRQHGDRGWDRRSGNTRTYRAP